MVSRGKTKKAFGCRRSQRANIWEVAGTESLTVTQEGAESEKSTRNDVDYAANGTASRRFAFADAVWIANRSRAVELQRFGAEKGDPC
jgi:hypothetical protein